MATTIPGSPPIARTLAIGSDHRGVELKRTLCDHLRSLGMVIQDMGSHEEDRSVDYPEFGKRVALAVSRGECDLGILICGTGIGQSIVANRFPGVRAALALNPLMAERARAHNDANILVLGGDLLKPQEALELVQIFLTTPFEGGRHARRLLQIETIERELKGEDPEEFLSHLKGLKHFDPDLYQAVVGELRRQEEGLELIASENFVSPLVLKTMATVFTNKYAEGYPGNRYYGGCTYVDIVERLAEERAKALFGAEFANVQPHSGSQANMAAYLALIQPGDRILGMDLANGGHLTHGAKVNFSGFLFSAYSYGVDPQTGLINYEEVAEIARRVKPSLIIAGASAYPRTLDFQRFSEIAREVSAFLVVDMAHIAGLVAVGIHPSPIPHSDLVTTTTHKTLRGPRGGMILGKAVHAKAVNSRLFPGIQGGPLMHIIAAKAVALKEAMTPEFKGYQERIVINARTLAEELKGYGYKLVSGGTDTHLFLVDLSDTPITGKEAEEALEKAGITVNKNTVPGEKRPPRIASGIRIGTPAVTTRGMGPEEMKKIAGWIHRALTARDREEELNRIRKEVRDLCAGFPLYRF